MPNVIAIRKFFALLALVIGLSGCASVPPEVVELSYTIGQDIREIERSYDALITSKFDALRQDRLSYLDNEWTPTYLKDFLEAGRMDDIAQGNVVWSESDEMFVSPTPGLEIQQRLETLLVWTQTAIEEIEGKRAELIDPLDDQEQRVRAEAAAAFDQILSSNAYVTAHLNSIKKVKDVQDQALGLLGAESGIAKLNQKIIDISNWADKGLEDIRKMDESIE